MVDTLYPESAVPALTQEYAEAFLPFRKLADSLAGLQKLFAAPLIHAVAEAAMNTGITTEISLPEMTTERVADYLLHEHNSPDKRLTVILSAIGRVDVGALGSALRDSFVATCAEYGVELSSGWNDGIRSVYSNAEYIPLINALSDKADAIVDEYLASLNLPFDARSSSSFGRHLEFCQRARKYYKQLGVSLPEFRSESQNALREALLKSRISYVPSMSIGESLVLPQNQDELVDTLLQSDWRWSIELSRMQGPHILALVGLAETSVLYILPLQLQDDKRVRCHPRYYALWNTHDRIGAMYRRLARKNVLATVEWTLAMSCGWDCKRIGDVLGWDPECRLTVVEATESVLIYEFILQWLDAGIVKCSEAKRTAELSYVVILLANGTYLLAKIPTVVLGILRVHDKKTYAALMRNMSDYNGWKDGSPFRHFRPRDVITLDEMGLFWHQRTDYDADAQSAAPSPL